MPKLYFRYGAMNSGKTIQLLTAAHQYESQGKKVAVIKPQIDTRNGVNNVWSRVGLERKADIVLPHQSLLTDEQIKYLTGMDCCFVDEVQFCHPRQIEQFSLISLHVPVICYGLRSDFRGVIFSQAISTLFALADKIEEIKNICKMPGCNSKSSFNFKIISSSDGNEAKVELGSEDVYVGICKKCFYEKRGQQDSHLMNAQLYLYDAIKIEPEQNPDPEQEENSDQTREDIDFIQNQFSYVDLSQKTIAFVLKQCHGNIVDSVILISDGLEDGTIPYTSKADKGTSCFSSP